MCGKCCNTCKAALKKRCYHPITDEPIPGDNGIQHNQLQGITCCLSGRFFLYSVDVPPSGRKCTKNCKCLDFGKPEARLLISNFKGRCVLDISGSVHFMVIGDQPGMKKMEEATRKFIPFMHMRVIIVSSYITVFLDE